MQEFCLELLGTSSASRPLLGIPYLKFYLYQKHLFYEKEDKSGNGIVLD